MYVCVHVKLAAARAFYSRRQVSSTVLNLSLETIARFYHAVQYRRVYYSAIQARTPIWQSKHSHHMNRNVLNKLWKEIAELFPDMEVLVTIGRVQNQQNNQNQTLIPCDDIIKVNCVNITTTTTTTENTRTRRRKTRMRRTKTSTLSPTTTVTTTFKPFKTKEGYGGLTQAQMDAYNYMLFVWKWQNFYCYKWTECINDHLYFERYPARVCGRDWATRTLVYFDHLCTLWRANCKGLGMFFHKNRMLCDRASPPVQVYMDYEYVDPPELVIFSVTSGFGPGRK